jgi:hypothetical protein
MCNAPGCNNAAAVKVAVDELRVTLNGFVEAVTTDIARLGRITHEHLMTLEGHEERLDDLRAFDDRALVRISGHLGAIRALEGEQERFDQRLTNLQDRLTDHETDRRK